MLRNDQLQQAIGSTAYGTDGEKIGKVGQIYLDDQTGRPEWATVNTGLLGTRESFVPLSEASFSGDQLTVPYTKDKVKDAPNVSDSDGHLLRTRSGSCTSTTAWPTPGLATTPPRPRGTRPPAVAVTTR